MGTMRMVEVFAILVASFVEGRISPQLLLRGAGTRDRRNRPARRLALFGCM